MLKIHFDKQLNFPDTAVWSLTAYAVDNFKPASTINSMTVNKNMLQYNYDGSLDLFIQPNDPGPGKQHNWLRTPAGDIFVVMKVSMHEAVAANNSADTGIQTTNVFGNRFELLE
ncbi:MAG TPA: DUF1214 domain-containing protein [Chitinophagaceae bacterium]